MSKQSLSPLKPGAESTISRSARSRAWGTCATRCSSSEGTHIHLESTAMALDELIALARSLAHSHPELRYEGWALAGVFGQAQPLGRHVCPQPLMKDARRVRIM